jgi:predicted dehydrogenase
MKDKKVTIAIVGLGSRGLTVFGEYVRQHPEEASLVAVAEPREHFRSEAVRLHPLRPENVFLKWEDLLARPRLADAIVITTTDRLHTAPAVLAAEKGYHILLEKPMAPTAEECIRIVQAAKTNRILLAVCHVLRYAPYYDRIKEIIDSGTLGDVCTIQHLEGVAWWHQAHSFVRGNFGNEARSSFMLLAKSCHDVDVLRWWIGKRCLRVASFGDLKHFRPECRPARATARCLDCPLGDGECPYSAKKFYFDCLAKGRHGWPLDMVVTEFTEAALTEALRSGPYGRCVYGCDNDVVDHQVVIMEFEDRISADFTMSAFTPHGRQTRIMGSRGYLEGQENVIRVLDFRTGQWTEYNANALATDMTGGHGGGDPRLMEAFIKAVGTGDAGFIRTGPDVTLESHLIVFAAERARRENRVVNMDEMYAER